MKGSDDYNQNGFIIGVVIAILSFVLKEVIRGTYSQLVALAGGLLCAYLSTISRLGWIKIQRRLEGKVGGFLLKLGTRKLLQKAKLVPRTHTLQKSGITLHYYERVPTLSSNNNSNKSTTSNGATPNPTLVLFHGFSSEPENLSSLVYEIAKGLPEDWRMILPTTIGHGKDMERAWGDAAATSSGSSSSTTTTTTAKTKEFPIYVDPHTQFELFHDLLVELGIVECCAYGASLGGALAYWLQIRYPHLVKKTILISPAVEAVIDEQFMEDFARGVKNHFAWESRDDVQKFMEDLCCCGGSGPQQQQQQQQQQKPKQKQPVPSFMLQPIWEDRKRRAPPRHFRNYLQLLIDTKGIDPLLSSKQDVAPNLSRLVFWPQNDFVSNHDKGKAFFAAANPKTTKFVSIPDCGHLFHSNGQTVLVHTAPQMVEYLLQ